MQQQNVPYEFLVRWDHQTGALKGAHVKLFSTIIGDAGEIIMQKEGDAQAVAVAGAIGFPLDAILDSIQAGAVIASDMAKAAQKVAEDAQKAAETELSTEKAKVAEAQAALATEQAAHGATAARLEELTSILNAVPADPVY